MLINDFILFFHQIFDIWIFFLREKIPTRIHVCHVVKQINIDMGKIFSIFRSSIIHAFHIGLCQNDERE